MPQAPIAHRNIPVLEVAEPRILDELTLDRQTSAMLLTRLSDRAALIDPTRCTALVARLRKLGHLPKDEE